MADRALFISHASEDVAVVRRIVEHLERAGVSCWIAERDIPPRAIYAEAIAEAMRTAHACAVVVSSASNASVAVKRELELASRYGRPFVPIRIDKSEPAPGVDYYLNNVQWVEYGRDGEAALDRIAEHMRPRDGASPAPVAQTQAPPRKRFTLVNIWIAAAVALVAVIALTQLAPTQSQSEPEPAAAPAAVPIVLQAAAFSRGTDVAAGACVDEQNVLANAAPCAVRPNAVEYDFDVAAPGAYELQIEYAALESRPVQISLNGGLVAYDALAATTGGWSAEHQTWSVVGLTDLRLGQNTLRLESGGVFPHIRTISFRPASSP